MDPLTSFLIRLVADPDLHDTFLKNREEALNSAAPPLSQAAKDAVLSADPQRILDEVNCQIGVLLKRICAQFLPPAPRARKVAARAGSAKKKTRRSKMAKGKKR